MIVRWPGQTEPNSVTPSVVRAFDLFPTFADLAGADVANLRLDSQSILDILRHQRLKPRKTPPFVWCKTAGSISMTATSPSRRKSNCRVPISVKPRGPHLRWSRASPGAGRSKSILVGASTSKSSMKTGWLRTSSAGPSCGRKNGTGSLSPSTDSKSTTPSCAFTSSMSSKQRVERSLPSIRTTMRSSSAMTRTTRPPFWEAFGDCDSGCLAWLRKNYRPSLPMTSLLETGRMPPLNLHSTRRSPALAVTASCRRAAETGLDDGRC